MKRNICVRSMGLGAVIMFIGLAVGAIVSPPLDAQRNGVFDEIQCTKLTVVDNMGKPAVRLGSYENWGNGVIVYNKQGKGAVRLRSNALGNGVVVYNKQGNEAVALDTDEHGGIVNVSGKDSGSASMFTRENGGVVRVKGKDGGGAVMSTNEDGGIVGVSGKDGGGAEMSTNEDGGIVGVSGKDSGDAEMLTDEHGGRFDVYNNQGKPRAAMGINEFGNGAVSTWDKNGYRQ